MNQVLLWKEYRQQRAIWLVIALLGILLVLILGLAMGQGSGLDVFRDGSIRPTLITIILALGVTYGIVCGALLLAGEKEDRTLDFLDGLAGQRGPVWRRKATAGALFTLAQGLVMAILIAVLGLGSWRTALIVLYWCLDGLAWGLLGGSLCQKVLVAVLAGIAFMASSWLLALFVNTSLALYLGKAMLAGAAVLSSRRIFCQDDPSRQTAPQKRFTIPLPAGWRVLLWLCFRQGRWVLAGELVFAIALGLTVNLAPLIIWPIGSLLLGLACGLAAFCPDQGDGNRFLGAQRFSPDAIFPVKIGFWGLATILLTVIAWQLGLASLFYWDPNAAPESWFERWLGSLYVRDYLLRLLTPGLFLILWPLYGFCFGQFFGLVAARPIIGAILATVVASLTVVLWVPSLFFGGVPAWQFLAVPLLLLATTRLAIWPWISGRLRNARSLLGIAGAVALVAITMAGFLYYRAVEVPDVGEPFDVKSFSASLSAPEQNQAGPQIRSAVAAMREQKKKVEEQIKPPTKPIFPPELGHPTEKFRVRDYEDASGYIPEKGWPKNDKEFGRWLDQIFQGAWVNQASKAVRLPLGLIQDPRLTSFDTRDWKTGDGCSNMGLLFACRALQLQARGDSRQALQHLEAALALSRQLRHNSPDSFYLAGHRMEGWTLKAFEHWLEKIGPDKKLLREALTLLQRHEAAIPDATGTIKAEYLILGNSLPSVHEKKLVEELHRAAYQTPWEKERQDRIDRAATLGRLRQAEKPPWQVTGSFDPAQGLPPEHGPGSGLSAKEWEKFLGQSWAETHSMAHMIPRLRRRPSLRAAQLVTALLLYQADKGHLPAQLNDLVPNYLAALPIDPSTGKSFHYRISKGEEIKGDYPGDNVMFRLAPGQALVWSEASNERQNKFPVPMWKK